VSIAPITPPVATPELSGAAELRDHKPADGLAESFVKALGDAKHLEQASNDAAEKFANDDPSMGIHEVIIASEKANIAIRYATTLKNKAIEAYQSLMNTQV